MTLHQLKIFAAIARHRNITRAARELDISQPTASQQIQLLEAEYGVQLFKRIGRGIELAEAGELLLADAEAVLTEVEELKKKFSTEWSARKEAAVNVGGSHSPSASFLPLIGVVFKETHPHAALSLRTDTSQGIVRLLLNSEIEIGVITNPAHDPSIVIEPCWQERLVAFVSARHPLAKKEKLTVAELAHSPLVIKVVKQGKEGDDRVARILKELQTQGFELNIVMQCESPDAAKAAVRTGVGLGILYERLIAPELKKGDFKILKTPELKPKMKVEASIIYHKERPLSLDAEDFLMLLRKWTKRSKVGRMC